MFKYGLIAVSLLVASLNIQAETLSNYASHTSTKNSVSIVSDSGQQLKVTAFSPYLIRVQRSNKVIHFLQMIIIIWWIGSKIALNFLTLKPRKLNPSSM